MTLLIIGLSDFFNAICVSLQSPFFPKEAEDKGCSATEYGLVFGIFELVVFIISPIYGRHIQRVGPKRLFNLGIFTSAVSAICFGLLDNVPGHYPFITLAFVIRIIEALGNAAFLTASFSIIAKEFPNNIATTFVSSLSTGSNSSGNESSGNLRYQLLALPPVLPFYTGILGNLLWHGSDCWTHSGRRSLQYRRILSPLCGVGHLSPVCGHNHDHHPAASHPGRHRQ